MQNAKVILETNTVDGDLCMTCTYSNKLLQRFHRLKPMGLI